MPAAVLKNRKERLEARVSTELKAIIEHAAKLQGRSITDFVIGSLEVSARETLREYESLKLNAADSARVVKALMNPPKPKAALKKAFALHRKTVEMA
jgi:uncharacterized protein (DUF1778 family)